MLTAVRNFPTLLPFCLPFDFSRPKNAPLLSPGTRPFRRKLTAADEEILGSSSGNHRPSCSSRLLFRLLSFSISSGLRFPLERRDIWILCNEWIGRDRYRSRAIESCFDRRERRCEVVTSGELLPRSRTLHHGYPFAMRFP